MTERILSIITEKRREGATAETSQRMIKYNIKKHMNSKGIDVIDLSKNAHINIFILMYLLYCPFSKVKLSKSIKICNALNLKPLDLFD